MLQRLLLLLAFVVAPVVAAAPVVTTEQVEARLVAEHSAAAPGKPAVVALRLRMQDHWHTYWKNPGDSGQPTRVDWQLPAGWTAGPIEWPHPKPLPVGPLMNYGYEGEVLLMMQLTPPADAAPGPVTLRAQAEWLVCKDICIPERGELELDWAIAAGGGPADPAHAAAFARTRASMPATAAGWQLDGAIDGQLLTLRIEPPPGASVPPRLVFFPEREAFVEHAAPQTPIADGRALRLQMRLMQPVAADVGQVAGVLVADAAWPGTDGRRALAVTAPLGAALPAPEPPAAGAPAAAGADRPAAGLALALAWAFVGGLILNLMPCVFPVLGIKVMGFVSHAHGERRAMRLQGVVYTVGVLLSFLVLAGLLLALRAGGAQLGWGFQLQSPGFVAFLAALFFVLALNLSGVFEWGAFAQSASARLSARGRHADALLAGVLATVVATPCTAPFMGAAVGFTLAQPPGVALAVFAMLGFGMALPVLVLAWMPGLLQRLPRPGAWMATFKQVMAFPLYATVVWLAWVLGAQAGNDAVAMLLAGLVAIAVAAWIHGRWALEPGWWRPALVTGFSAFGLWLAWPGPVTAPPADGAIARQGSALPWQAWSPERVAELTAAGRPVFVDFTAAWCVTCQVNKRVALAHPDVARAFAERGVVPLMADWTHHDARITAALAAFGRNAVPVYALYPPDGSEPRLLPEILTPSIVVTAVASIPAMKAVADAGPAHQP